MAEQHKLRVVTRAQVTIEEEWVVLVPADFDPANLDGQDVLAAAIEAADDNITGGAVDCVSEKSLQDEHDRETVRWAWEGEA